VDTAWKEPPRYRRINLVTFEASHGFSSRPGHVTDPYAHELAKHDSSPSFLIQATFDRDGNELTAEVASA
jgi:hypothetical protein